MFRPEHAGRWCAIKGGEVVECADEVSDLYGKYQNTVRYEQGPYGV